MLSQWEKSCGIPDGEKPAFAACFSKTHEYKKEALELIFSCWQYTRGNDQFSFHPRKSNLAPAWKIAKVSGEVVPGCHPFRYKRSLLVVLCYTLAALLTPTFKPLSFTWFPTPHPTPARILDIPIISVGLRQGIHVLLTCSVLVTHDHGTDLMYFLSHVLASFLTFFLASLLLESSRAFLLSVF